MKRLFLYFSGIFVLLMGIMFFGQYHREHQYRIEQLNMQLTDYINFVQNYLSEQSHSTADIRNFMRLVPDSTLRITVIDLQGVVFFDSFLDSVSLTMENHLTRPEIVLAQKQNFGQDVRFSTSAKREYYYLARKFPDKYVRAALPYDRKLQHELSIDTFFLYIIAFLLIVSIVAIYFITSKAVQKVQNQKAQMRRQLTQNMSHELKTPIASISGYLESILEHPELSKEKQHFFIERSFAQTKRLTSLLQDISILNHLTDNEQIYQKTDNDLVEIIADVLADARLQIEKHGCLIQTDMPDHLLIMGNRTLLYSIFRNMLDNSLAYADNGVNIKIQCLCDDDKFYYFSFSDNGKGVPDECLNRIFERFYRIDQGRSRKTGGSGLGLAIVKNAIMYHGGIINVRNKPDGGLDFTFSLAKGSK
ncbi:MAG: hypothetical protein EOM76_06340 [Sphingobacteriia bacterium]|nr:ATP-binding protein [Paludibacteraceae bacterium]NCA79791.1 hypothetical protein [Sphingobacteriia bacterium]